jgi:hypothetical protein
MNMMNGNMNQNMNNMNNQNMIFPNNNMMQNNQFSNMNNFQNNNGMNNMNNGMNGMNVMNNNNLRYSQISNNNNTLIVHGQNVFDYNYLGGKTEAWGQIVSFIFEFKQQKYSMKAKNNRIFKDVVNEFLNSHPEIKSSITMNQRYSVNGDVVDVNKSLFELGIKSGSIVIIVWLGNN